MRTCYHHTMRHLCFLLLMAWTISTPVFGVEYYDQAVASFNRRADALDVTAPEYRPRLMVHGQRTKHVVVLLHGVLDSPASMQEIAKLYFDAGFNVIIGALPGHTGHEDQAATYAKLKLWRDSTDFLLYTALSLGRHVHVGGHSLGAGLLVDAIPRFGGRVSSIVAMTPMFRFAPKLAKLFKIPNFSSWLGSYLPEKIAALPNLSAIMRKSHEELSQMASDIEGMQVMDVRMLLVTVDSDKVISNKDALAFFERHGGIGEVITIEGKPKDHFTVPTSEGASFAEVRAAVNRHIESVKAAKLPNAVSPATVKYCAKSMNPTTPSN